MQTLFENVILFSPKYPGKAGWLLVENGVIRKLGEGQFPEREIQDIHRIDGKGFNLLPGLIDIHVHGGMGWETMDATPQALMEMSRFYAAHGVTTFLAATWSASRITIEKALENIRFCTGALPGGATLAGAYLEGPWINPLRAGAQPLDQIRAAEHDEAEALLDMGVVKVAVLAPEIPENFWLIDACTRRGIVPAIGHSDATFEQVERAVQYGVRLVSHWSNGMSPFHQRAPGLIGAALAMPELTCELIADGVHVHPGSIQILQACKGVEGIILITDGIRGAGLQDGEFPIEGINIQVKGSVARNEKGSLAGSTQTLEHDFQNLITFTGRRVEELWVTSSWNAAKMIGVEKQTGSLEVEKDADLILVDGKAQVLLTMRRGEIIFRNGAFL